MKAAPYIVIFVLLAIFVAISMRNRRRQIAEDMVRTSRIDVGTEVMTTSGLYGTVVGRNDDGTVILAIAPGVEVKWAIAALRDAESLSDRYRQAIDDDDKIGIDGSEDQHLDEQSQRHDEQS